MTWTYDVSQLATSPLYQVRYLVGDVDTNDQQVQDEEINFVLTLRPSIWGAAATVCLSLASQLSRQADVVDKDLRNTYSQRSKAYTQRAMNYEQQAQARAGSMPYSGGISLSDKRAQEQNQDRVPPQFNLGMMDNYLPVGPVGNETESGEIDIEGENEE